MQKDEKEVIELSVKVSNSEQHYTQKFLIHQEGLSLSHDDPELARMVNEAIANFKGSVDDVLVKVKFTW
jgi:hypothetical protein